MSAPEYLTINELPVGTTGLYEFSFAGGYLEQAHVKLDFVSPLGARTNYPLTAGMFVSEFTLQIPVGDIPAGTVSVRIYRETPRSEPLINFTNGARITERNLDRLAQQTIFVAAEAFDAGAFAVAEDLIGQALTAIEDANAALAAAGTIEASAAASAAAALASQTAATASEASALTQANSALASKDAAALSAAAALASQTAAAGSATAASGSASAAATSASDAATSASTATTQATSAANSATAAAGSASTASTQAGIAATQAGNAATSATNAANSATAAAASATAAAASASATKMHGQCRLVLDGSNIRLNRFNGAALIIDGVVQSIPSAGVSLAPSGLTPNTRYYIYAYMNAGVMTLEASATGYSTHTDGGVIKTGDQTRTLVGMVYVVTGPAFADSGASRLVASYFNRRPKAAALTVPTNRTTTSATFVEMSSADRVFSLNWADETVQVGVTASTLSSSAGSTWYIAYGIDSAAVRANVGYFSGGTTVSLCPMASVQNEALAEGFHYTTLLGLITGGATLTVVGGYAQIQAVTNA